MARTVLVFSGRARGQFLLNDTNTSNNASFTFSFGQNGDRPLAGDWDGKP